MTLDAGTITQLAVGAVFSLILWLIRDKVSGVQTSLDALSIGFKALEHADYKTDKQVELQAMRIQALEVRATAIEAARAAYMSDVSTHLGRMLEEAKGRTERSVDDIKAKLAELKSQFDGAFPPKRRRGDG